MNLPTFCIKRPVFATVLSLLLIVFGIMGYQKLHTRFFPRFIRNAISITTSYPGASANLVESAITTPLEKAITGLEGIETISSTSAQGISSIKVKIAAGTNLYDITNKIRNHIALAAGNLPSSVKSPVVQMGHSDMDLMDIGFSIDSNNLQVLRDYLDRYVINHITQLPGISTVQVFGANKYAINIKLNPNSMATRHITPSDIAQAIQNNNLELPAGEIKTPDMDIPVTAKTGLKTPAAFANIAIKNVNGKPIYLKDVATVSLGDDSSQQSIVQINGHRAILLSIFNASNANPIAASDAVRKLLTTIKQQLPSSMQATITFDQADFMKASIAEVYKSILIAIGCVALIIFFSLGKFRSSLIPMITIPICVIATMGAMSLFGFTINLITLLAIVLSIGLVVDDAIVVLENIDRHIEQGKTKLQAAIAGSKEIASPVIAMTLTLAAVYAPIGLIKGSISHIFASFAFTLAAAVLISGFVALTLSPMMCSKILNDQTAHNGTQRFINHFFDYLTFKYDKILSVLLRHRTITSILTITITIAGFAVGSLSKTFMPNEDMGFVITQVNAASGSNNQTNEKSLLTLNHILNTHKEIKTNVIVTANRADDNDNNMIFSTLKPFSQRSATASQVAAQVNQQITKIPGLSAAAFSPSFGGSTHQQIAFYVMAPRNYKSLYDISNNLIQELSKYPGLKNLHTNLKFNSQQYEITVNRALASQLGVSVRNIDQMLANLIGGTRISTFNTNGQSYDVIMQAAKPYLSNIDMLKQFQVLSNTNQLIPLGNLINIKSTLLQPTLFHYNQLRAAKIHGELAANYKLGSVVHYLQQALPKALPSDTKYAFTGQAARIVRSTNTMSTIFLLAVIFIYLVLSAQFESFIDPLIILLAVPLSVVGAIISLKITGGSINIYTVIGLVTLVGLIAKHGILITQFANSLQKSGLNTVAALKKAATIRLRPILMTTAAMVFGALPLVFASGASANSRTQIGIVIVGGLLFGTFFSLILVPVAYSIMAQLKTKVRSLANKKH